jgi:hypothetical protein
MSLLRADKLRMNSLQKKTIDSYVKSFLSLIDEKINAAHKAGGCDHIEYTLPIRFDDVPNLENKDSQRKIYAKIIQSLKERGFEVEFTLGDTSARLFVTWLSKAEQDEINYEISLIAKHTKTLIE